MRSVITDFLTSAAFRKEFFRSFSVVKMDLSAVCKLGERYKSNTVPIEHLNQPIKFRVAKNVIAKNKFIKAPMTEMLGTFDAENGLKSGLPTEELINLYRKWNDGGSAILVTGCIAISEKDIEAVGNTVISKDVDTSERRNLFKKISSTATDGTLIIAQILHPGRRAVPILGKCEPMDMNNASVDYLNRMVEQHIYAAEYAKQCGFHGVEINVSQDFALGQLVTATTNSRSDNYGGSLINRTNILFQIIDGIRNCLKDDENFLLGMKMSSVNYEPSFNEQEFSNYCKKIEKSKLDYVTVAGGLYNSIHNIPTDPNMKESTRNRETFFAKFATEVRKNLKTVNIFLCGGFFTIEQMWEALYEGWCNGITIGKPLAAEPDLPRRILNEEILSAKRSLLFGLDHASKSAAGTQLWQVANNLAILDLTNESQVASFRDALSEHSKLPKTIGTDINNFGYPKFRVDNL